MDALESKREEAKKEVARIFSGRIKDASAVGKLAEQLFRGALNGQEIDAGDPSSFEEWVKQRFKYQLTWLSRDDYAKALVRALWLAPRFAATDFGGARQRDFAQVWTDTARGFLGEIAFQKFLDSKLNVKIQLDVRRGVLEKFLPSDIKVKDESTGLLRDSKVKVSIKTTKFNGRWLDIPGAQFDHSDAFLLVKLGISRFHFSAFLKDISFLKDKLFALAKDMGELTNDQAQELWKETPDFTPVPAYIAGYIEKQGLTTPIHQIICRARGWKHKRITISGGVGLFSLTNVRQHPKVVQIDPNGARPVEVEPIIKSLTEAKHFLANSGALKFGADAWSNLAKRL